MNSSSASSQRKRDPPSICFLFTNESYLGKGHILFDKKCYNKMLSNKARNFKWALKCEADLCECLNMFKFYWKLNISHVIPQ